MLRVGSHFGMIGKQPPGEADFSGLLKCLQRGLKICGRYIQVIQVQDYFLLSLVFQCQKSLVYFVESPSSASCTSSVVPDR